MLDKSATALTAEYPRVAGRRIISRPDGRTALTAVRSSAEVPAAARPPAAGCVLSTSAQDKWRWRQQTTTRSRKQDGEGAAEVDERVCAGERWQGHLRTDCVTADVIAATVAVNLLTTRLLKMVASIRL